MDNNENIKYFLVAGCGGTGSIFLENVFRYISGIRDNLDYKIKIMIFDPDIVETKNIERQNFYKEDVGKSKVKCIVERYKFLYENKDFVSVYGIKDKFSLFKCLNLTCNNINYKTDGVSEYLINSKEYFFSRNSFNRKPILKNIYLFSCIDSVFGRMDIINQLDTYIRNTLYKFNDSYIEKIFLIDSGNSINSGQIKIYDIVKEYFVDMDYNPQSFNFEQFIVDKDDNLLKKTTRDDFTYYHNQKELNSEYADDFIFEIFKDIKAESCTNMPTQTRLMNSLGAQLLYGVFMDIMENKDIIVDEVCFSKYNWTTKYNF